MNDLASNNRLIGGLLGVLIALVFLGAYTLKLKNELEIAQDRYARLQRGADEEIRKLTDSLTQTESQCDLLKRRIAALAEELKATRAAASERLRKEECPPCPRKPNQEESPHPASMPAEHSGGSGDAAS